MKFVVISMVISIVTFAFQANAGIDPGRPQCVRECIRDGGEARVCYASCWYCNVHNSYCPDIRSFCGYEGPKRVGWMINVTSNEAFPLGDQGNSTKDTFDSETIGANIFKIFNVSQGHKPVGVLKELDSETAVINGMTLTRLSCQPR